MLVSECIECGKFIGNVDIASFSVDYAGSSGPRLANVICNDCYSQIQQASLEHPSVETNAKRATNEEEKR